MHPIERANYEARFDAHWKRFIERFDLTSPKAPVILRELSAQYGAEDRYYHWLGHIVLMLDLLEQVRKDVPKWFKNPLIDAAIELGVWCHDVIYDTTESDNEERSAELSRTIAMRLGFPDPVVELVSEYVRATDHKQMQSDLGAQILCDLDLASLGLPWDEFRANSLKIQLEYRHVSNADFKAGRAAFFKQMLKRPQIYQTTYFYGLFETDARGNMRYALRKDLAK